MKFWAVLVVVLLVLGGVAASFYNKFAVLDETVSGAWSQVQNQYKRRADLIPNLVSTVQGYATHEKDVFAEVTNARAKVGEININAQNLTPEMLKTFSQAQGELSSALSRLIAVSEAYPELKANENFKDLQAQLEGTENRIAVARKDYIAAVKEFNIALRTFPGNIIASIFHPSLSIKPNFEASEAEQHAPSVSFAK